MTNLEIIKKAVSNAHPEVVELKFGTQIVRKHSSDGRIKSSGKNGFILNRCPNPHCFYAILEGNQTASLLMDHEIESIGRRIGIADVLLAIEEKKKKGGVENLSNWYAVSTHGLFLENKIKEITPRPYANPMISTGYAWNLRHDDLEHQSEETKAFLAGLLKETS